MYLSLEKLEPHLEFWRSLLIVSSASLENLRNERSIGTTAFAAQSRANASVKAQITQVLAGKSYDQLVALQGQVQRKLSSGAPVDVEYWEGLLKELIVWKAKGKLRDMHEVVLNNRLEQLRRKQRDEAIRYKEEVKHALHLPSSNRLEEIEEGDEEEVEMDLGEDEEVVAVEAEAWDPSLEPRAVTKIPEELKAFEILHYDEEMQRLVRLLFPLQLFPYFDTNSSNLFDHSTLNVVRLFKLDSLRNAKHPLEHSPSSRRMLETKRSTKPLLDKDSTRRKSYSAWKPTCRRRLTLGRTNIDQGSRGTSTKSTLVTNGTSTIKRITIVTIPLRKLFK